MRRICTSIGLLLVLLARSQADDTERVPFVRTPDERFAGLSDYPFAPHYLELSNGLRLHYVDEGEGEIILLLHGEPSWSYLYRKMIPILAAKHRVIAPDFLGFGKSDKPTRKEDFTYDLNYQALVELIEKLDLENITLVCQDWGGLLGLPVAMDHADRFARLVIMNTGLPTGDIDFATLQNKDVPQRQRQNLVAFLVWRAFAARQTDMNVGEIIDKGTVADLPAEVRAAYDAPFPDASFKVGAHLFPLMVPIRADDPVAEKLRGTRSALAEWEKPALVMFSDLDPITVGGDAEFRALIPSARDEPEIVIANAGHFLQEDRGEEIAEQILAFLKRRPIGR